MVDLNKKSYFSTNIKCILKKLLLYTFYPISLHYNREALLSERLQQQLQVFSLQQTPNIRKLNQKMSH